MQILPTKKDEAGGREGGGGGAREREGHRGKEIVFLQTKSDGSSLL